MASTLPFSMIGVARPRAFPGIPGQYRPNVALFTAYACFDKPAASDSTLDPFSALVDNLRNVINGYEVSQILGHSLYSQVENGQL